MLDANLICLSRSKEDFLYIQSCVPHNVAFCFEVVV